MSRVVWLPGSDVDVVTDGHIDGTAKFVRPGVVLAEVARDPQHPEHGVLAENLRARLAPGQNAGLQLGEDLGGDFGGDVAARGMVGKYGRAPKDCAVGGPAARGGCRARLRPSGGWTGLERERRQFEAASPIAVERVSSF